MNLPLLEPCKHVLPADEFDTRSQLLADIGQGDDPIAVMLTCSELGYAPDQVSHANPGEIMIIQNAGGLVPAANTEDAFIKSVIYGLSLSTVRHLIVCGHTECKTLGLLLVKETQGKKNPFDNLMQCVGERLHTTYRDRPAREWLGIVIQETILQQIANLRSHAYIQSRLRQAELLLHGWIRNDQTSTITAYDAVTGQFCD
jgi:carbonic anhydrase